MASLTTTSSLQFPISPFSSSSKTLISTPKFPISLPLFYSSIIPTSINLFKSIPSSPIIQNVTVSSNSHLDNEETELNCSNKSKLFVGNLPFHVDNSTLARLFQQSGTVEMVEVVYDILNRRSRGFAFVKMSSVKEAEIAVKMFDGYELDGKQLRVNYRPPPRKKSIIKEPRHVEKSDSNTTNTVYVGNLSWRVDNETLETLFWEHGNVMKAKVFYDKESGRSRGFGFVTYSCANEVYNAVKSLDGVDLDGRNIRVSVAVPLQRHQV